MTRTSKAADDKAAQQVRWIGSRSESLILPHERMLTVGDWKVVHIQNADDATDTVWNAANNYTVPRSALAFLTDFEFQQYIEHDPMFVVEDVP